MINYNFMVVHVDGDGVIDATAREVFGALVGGVPVFITVRYGECGDLDNVPDSDSGAVLGFVSSFGIDSGSYYITVNSSTFSADDIDSYLTYSE